MIEVKLTKYQMNVLRRLAKPYMYGEENHPKDAYRQNTIDILKSKGLVETYFYRNFLHSAVRLTQLGHLAVYKSFEPNESAQPKAEAE